jgi:hypothetical protein
VCLTITWFLNCSCKFLCYPYAICCDFVQQYGMGNIAKQIFCVTYLFGDTFSSHNYRMGTVRLNILKHKFADLNSLVLWNTFISLLEAVYSNKNDNTVLPIEYSCINSSKGVKDAWCIKKKSPKVRLGGFILVRNFSSQTWRFHFSEEF